LARFRAETIRLTGRIKPQFMGRWGIWGLALSGWTVTKDGERVCSDPSVNTNSKAF
jgi:hypothetical protein